MLEKLTNREVDPITEHRIRDYMLEGIGTGEIVRRLQADDDVRDFPGEKSLTNQRKLVDRIKNDLRMKRDPAVVDESGVWSISDADTPEHTGLALAVLAHINKWSTGDITYLTIDEADAIIKIRTMCPRLRLHDVWELAQDYVSRRIRNEGVQEMEVFIGHLRLAHEPGALLEPVAPTGQIDLVSEKHMKGGS